MNKKKILIIAEAGVNHNGSLNLAKEMVDRAKECGADIIKFQTAKAEALVSKQAVMADYQKRNTGKVESQLEMLKKLLLTYSEFEKLAEYCMQQNMQFLSTPFDLESIAFLEMFKMPFWKIPSGEITNYPYLVKIGQTKKPVILSTGMSTMEEIEMAINVLEQEGCVGITLLHCNTEYPTPMCDVNLRAMNTLAEYFKVPVGYSDHTIGIEIAIAAAAMKAKVIEKHFTLDKRMEGPDHKASIEPDEFKKMVQSIRNIELAMGDGIKTPSDSEIKNRDIARKSIVALKRIAMGDIFTEDNITVKRPGNGISPMKWKQILGQRAICDFDEDEMISE